MAEKIVVIPTYNEKENISAILLSIFDLQQEFHVIVIDDGSPDGTARIVKDLQLKFPGQLFIEERRGKQGLGTAYIHGFKWALARGYQYIFEMDAIFPIIQMTFRDFMMPAKTAEQMLPLDRVM
jgi:dolichol-phosphate mannosyltransferase